jgi:hypothetical protein
MTDLKEIAHSDVVGITCPVLIAQRPEGAVSNNRGIACALVTIDGQKVVTISAHQGNEKETNAAVLSPPVLERFIANLQAMHDAMTGKAKGGMMQ